MGPLVSERIGFAERDFGRRHGSVPPVDTDRNEASWSAVVLQRFFGRAKRTAMRFRGGDVLVEDSEVPHGLELNGMGS
jgi:hypothetical protein